MAERLDTFDPNTTGGLWATYLPGRRPEFKVHKHLGHATNAMSSIYQEGIIYESVDGRWVEICRRQHSRVGTTCPQCGGNLKPAVGRTFVSQRFDRDHNGRLRKPVQIIALCEHCWDVR